MRVLLVLLLSILLHLVGSSQEYVGLTKPQTQHTLRNSKYEKRVLQFNERDICTAEIYEFSSKEVLKNKLSEILKKEKYSWVRINENQHVSSFNHQLLLEFQDEKFPYRLQVLRTDWTKELYELLLKN